ncbi:MAG: hypothetical protein WCN92_09235, partial [Eubacteriales bacterium]
IPNSPIGDIIKMKDPFAKMTTESNQPFARSEAPATASVPESKNIDDDEFYVILNDIIKQKK